MESLNHREIHMGISDEAVQAKTGRTWIDWFALLDSLNAQSKFHKDIASYLETKQELSGWWAQMVTVGYERARSLREEHQTLNGYEASVSKTFSFPVHVLYEAWEDEAARARWLGGTDLVLKKSTPNKAMRFLWSGNQTQIEVNFHNKGIEKSQVVVQIHKLANREEVADNKLFWGGALDLLKVYLQDHSGK